MGCRDSHVRRVGSNRSTEYYQTKEGRVKKKTLNEKRKKPEQKAHDMISSDLSDTHDEALTSYLQSTLSMIEGRTISQAEVRGHITRWNEQLRQQGLDRGKEIRILRDD